MEKTDTQAFTVLRAFRVGRGQHWLKPSDQPVELLPCEAQYPLQMGWLKPFMAKADALHNHDTLNTKTVAISAAHATTTEE